MYRFCATHLSKKCNVCSFVKKIFRATPYSAGTLECFLGKKRFLTLVENLFSSIEDFLGWYIHFCTSYSKSGCSSILFRYNLDYFSNSFRFVTFGSIKVTDRIQKYLKGKPFKFRLIVNENSFHV